MSWKPLRIGLCLAVVFLTSGCADRKDPALARHLILVTVDTLRADRIGAYGYEAANTPALDALARESIRFEYAYAHSSLTLPSLTSLLTGSLPAEHGLTGNIGRFQAELPTIAMRLRAAEFSSGAFIGSYVLKRDRGLDRGFDRYTYEYEESGTAGSQRQNSAALLTDQAIQWLAQRASTERLFLWIHYQEPHGPYRPAKFIPPTKSSLVLQQSGSNSGRGAIPRYQWLGHGRLDEYLARYDGEIAEFDRQLGRLVAELEKRKILDQSILVFAADHGEAFGEDDLFCAHGEGLHEVLLRVPLILRVPGHEPGTRSDVVRLIDVLPTLLELLAVESEPLRGQSLLRDTGDRPVVAQARGLRKGDWRRLRDDSFELVEELGVPPVMRDLSSGGREIPPAEQAELRRRMETTLQALAPWPSSSRHKSLSEEDKEALRAIGYID